MRIFEKNTIRLFILLFQIVNNFLFLSRKVRCNLQMGKFQLNFHLVCIPINQKRNCISNHKEFGTSAKLI